MDSDSTQPHPPPHHHLHPHHHTQPAQPIMMGPTTTASNNSYPTNANTLTTMSTTTNTAPPPPPPSATTTAAHTPSSVPVMSQQHQSQTQNTNPNNNPSIPRFPFNPVVNSSSSPALEYSDGSAASPRPSGFSIEPARKKRGRPRKYSPDGGNIALGLSPTPVTAISPVAGGQGDYSGGGGGTASSEPPAKRSRGRPPGSGKKQLNALGNAGVGFTPHVITVKAGEDIASKIMAFAQQGPRTVCILSANGAICNVTLRQSAMSGGTVTYEGRFEIISLSGSFMPSDSNGSRNRTGGLSVSLAGSDGRVLGGGVAGMLMAASPVQVVVGSFIADGKKPKSATPSSVASNMLSFGGPVSATSPPSQDASSDSSDENGGSPINHGPGSYNNAGQPMSMPMYTNMGWPNNSIKMHPN